MDRFNLHFPGGGGGGPRGSPACRKDPNLRRPSMCRRWDRLPLMSSWAHLRNRSPHHLSPITLHPSPIIKRNGTRRQKREDPIAPKTTLEIAITFPIRIDVSRSAISSILQVDRRHHTEN